MKLLKQRTIFTALVIWCGLMSAACARTAVGGEPKTIQDLNNRVLGLLVSPLLVKPADIQKGMDFFPSEVRAFPTSNELVTALKTKRVDAMGTTTNTSRFLISADDKLSILDGSIKTDNGLAMILRKADTDLLEELNSAIAVLRSEGTLDTLHEKYIANITVDRMADAPAGFPEIEGAETILVGINGDLPPYDYITADGKPAGFNVALMAEISRVLGKNIRFVTIPSEARFSALLSSSSRRMDLFFWFYGPLEQSSLVLTDFYALIDECILVRK